MVSMLVEVSKVVVINQARLWLCYVLIAAMFCHEL